MGSKKNIILLSLFCFFFLEISAQVGIGTTNPDASSVLDIESTNAGVLIPRVVLTSTLVSAPVSTPATSLLVYNTNTTTGANRVTPGFYFWNGIKWSRLNDNEDKVYGEINNSPNLYGPYRRQKLNATQPIRFEIPSIIQGVDLISFPTPIPSDFPSVDYSNFYQGFEIITSGFYRVSYSISLYMDDPGPPAPGSAKVPKFFLTTGVAFPTTITNLWDNRIRGSISYSRIVHLGYASTGINIIVHLTAGDHIRLFQVDNFDLIYVVQDSATMNIELIQAD